MQRLLRVLLDHSLGELSGGHDDGRAVGAVVGVSRVKIGSREDGGWGSAARYTAYAIASRTSGGYSRVIVWWGEQKGCGDLGERATTETYR